MTLEEIKKNLDRYKLPIHKNNPTAQNYVNAVETLLVMLINAEVDHMGDVELEEGVALESDNLFYNR